MNRHLAFKDKCRKKYGDPNTTYQKVWKWADGTKSVFEVLDMGDRENDFYLYSKGKRQCGMTLMDHEVKEFALALLEHLEYDVYLKESS